MSADLLSQNFDSEEEDDDFNPAPGGGSDDEANGGNPSDAEEVRSGQDPSSAPRRETSENERNGAGSPDGRQVNGKRARDDEAEEAGVEDEDAEARQSEEDAEGGGENLDEEDDEEDEDEDDEEAVSVSAVCCAVWLIWPLMASNY